MGLDMMYMGANPAIVTRRQEFFLVPNRDIFGRFSVTFRFFPPLT
jgi:hypothetical protein